jgi:mono/diheme cytochrome c family protein
VAWTQVSLFNRKHNLKGGFMFKNNLVKNTLLPLSILIILLLYSNCLLAHNWKAPKMAAQRRNPISLNQESIIKGNKIFVQNCASCHGDNVKGLSSEITGLQKDSPNLIQRIRNHSDGDFFWKIQNGKDEMPSFKEDLSENDIWNVVNYIKNSDKPKK